MLEGLSLVFCLRQRISRLTLREDPHSEIPLGLSCSGEASLTLLCRAFTPNLENAGKHTAHISDLRRFEPNTVFEIRQQSNSACWPVSQPGQPTCKTLDWGQHSAEDWREDRIHNPAYFSTAFDRCPERGVVHIACRGRIRRGAQRRN